MKKDSYIRFDFARRYNPDLSKSPVEVVDVDEDNKTPKDSLLSVVYALDPRTGLPTGDLTYYVSDKANPQIKEFILANLMMDTSSAKTPAPPAGLSDDALFELSRNKGESVTDYAARLTKVVDNFKFISEQYVSNRPGSTAVSSE